MSSWMHRDTFYKFEIAAITTFNFKTIISVRKSDLTENRVSGKMIHK